MNQTTKTAYEIENIFNDRIKKAQEHIWAKGLPIVYVEDGKIEWRNMEGYCVKCRKKREIQNAQEIVMKNGRPATQGTCPVCSTKIFRIGSSKK